MLARQYKRKKSSISNRLRFILAIIFLLAGITLFRLYDLQFLKYDLFVALASDQHQVYNKLEPVRGKIFLQDTENFSDESIYPIATNKDFALIYAVPGKIKDAGGLALKLYEIFDRPEIEKEVDEMLEASGLFATTSPRQGSGREGLSSASAEEEFKKIKRELEIELREKKIIEDYQAIFAKTGDPYEPLKSKTDEETLKKIIELNEPGLDYIMESHRYYPEDNIGSHILGFVGYASDRKSGQYGLEGFFNEELTGRPGSIRAERSANGELIIINDREFNKPVDGSNLILTINHSIQFTVCQKLNETVLRHGADAGSVVVMDPSTGAILAMCSSPDYDPNNYSDVDDITIYNNHATFSDYEPGSIFKVFTMAASINEGKVTPQSTYLDRGFMQIEGWPKPIKNSDFESFGGHGQVDMVAVLEKSLNTGAIFAMQRIGTDTFAKYVKDFGFGEKAGVELETEVTGDITNLKRKTIRPVEAATASFGQGITATPIQLVTAFAAVANGGILMQPYLVGEIIKPDGTKIKTQPKQIRRILSERTSLLISGMLVNVVDRGHAKRAGVSGYFIGGKTGTAQVADKEKGGYGEYTIHSFIGFGPVDDPKFVMLVRLDHPRSAPFAESTAAPLFNEIADFILNYYQVPKER